MNRKVLTLTLVLGLLAATALAVYAETATVVITAGSLSFTPAAITMSGVTLDGTDQSSTSASTANTWSAVDGRGTGVGWNVTIASTDFADGGSQTIDISAADSLFEIQLLDANITVTAGSTKPTSSVTALATIPTTPATALKFISSAASGAGMGTYSVKPNFALGIPAETYLGTGTYTATVTLTAVTAP